MILHCWGAGDDESKTQATTPVCALKRPSTCKLYLQLDTLSDPLTPKLLSKQDPHNDLSKQRTTPQMEWVCSTQDPINPSKQRAAPQMESSPPGRVSFGAAVAACAGATAWAAWLLRYVERRLCKSFFAAEAMDPFASSQQRGFGVQPVQSWHTP